MEFFILEVLKLNALLGFVLPQAKQMCTNPPESFGDSVALKLQFWSRTRQGLSSSCLPVSKAAVTAGRAARAWDSLGTPSEHVGQTVTAGFHPHGPPTSTPRALQPLPHSQPEPNGWPEPKPVSGNQRRLNPWFPCSADYTAACSWEAICCWLVSLQLVRRFVYPNTGLQGSRR